MIKRWLPLKLLMVNLTICICYPLTPAHAADSKIKKSITVEVTLPVVLGMAFRSSDSAQLIKQEYIDAKTPLMRAMAALDSSLTLSAIQTDSSADTSGGAFSPENVSAVDTSLGFSKVLRTGTSLSLMYKQKNQQTTYPSTEGSSDAVASFRPATDYWESQISFNMKQSLWKNAFGEATRAQIKAGEFSATANHYSIKQKLETWGINLIQLYYRTWFAKESWVTTKARVNRQQRLLDITRIKVKRGTAEKSELLQIESSVLNSQAQEQDARQSLADIWRQLIILLDLPDHWLYLPPEQVRIALDDTHRDTAALCANANRNFESEAQIQLRTARLKSAEQALVSATSQAKPDLYLDVNVSLNGIDKLQSNTTNALLNSDFPTYSFGVGLNIPMSNRLQQANYLTSFRNKLDAEVALTQKKDEVKIEWANRCHEFGKLSSQLKTYEKAWRNQLERVKIESRRFEIGQVDLFNVIQAENDALTADLSLKATEVEVRQVSWVIKKLADELSPYLNNLETSAPEIIK